MHNDVQGQQYIRIIRPGARDRELTRVLPASCVKPVNFLLSAISARVTAGVVTVARFGSVIILAFGEAFVGLPDGR